MIDLLARLIHSVKLRLAQLEAERQSVDPVAWTRLLCWLGDVPEAVTQGFLDRQAGVAEVARVLAAARVAGGPEALRTAEFLTDGSLEIWSAADRSLLLQIEDPFQR